MSQTTQDADEIAVVGIGEILWDLLPDGRMIGGAPTNFAYHANRQGVRAVAVSCVGADRLGQEIIDSLTKWRMDTRFVAVRSDYPTGTVTVQLDAKGVPDYTIHESVAWDHIPWTPEIETLAGSIQAVCFGTLGQRAPESRATIRHFLNATSPDCLRVCDINFRQHYFDLECVEASLQLANVLKLNDGELHVLAEIAGLRDTTLEILATIRRRFDLELVALTRGDSGSVLLTAEGASDHLGCPVDVVDTVGAGDAFTAALVVGLLRGDSPDAINASANQIAAQVCLHAGAIPGEAPPTVIKGTRSP